MENFNQIGFAIVFVTSLMNFFIAMETRRKLEHEFIFKICFGFLAIGSLIAMVYEYTLGYTLMIYSVAVILTVRLFGRKKNN